MSVSDSSVPGSPGSISQTSDPLPESGQRQPDSSALLFDYGEDDLVPYENEQLEYDDDVATPVERWEESSAYAAGDEGDFLSGDDDDLKRTHGGDDMLPAVYRENKYRGPASTWRHWTRHEREESSAIETSRARDLAGHLFNAYALKRRAANLEITEEQYETDDLRAKAAAASASSFKPPHRWAAWPVPASEVPRTETDIFKDEWTLRMEPDSRPSSELEEFLLAEMLRSAKERFERREWKGNRAKLPRGMKEETPKESGVDHITVEGEDPKSETDMDAEVEFRPVVSADDEASKRILLPSARHTLSQLDNLLLSLHYAREAYATRQQRSGTSTPADTDAESVVARKSSPKKRRLRITSRSQSRGRKRTCSSPAVEAPPGDSESGSEYVGSDGPRSRSPSGSEDPEQEERTGRRRATSGTDRKGRLGLRDWSDIVGIASMTGWPQPVIMRTAQRCAHLFGEEMLFRTFDEEQTSKEANDMKRPTRDERAPEESGRGSRSTSRKEKAGADQGAGFGQTPSLGKLFCPVEGCARQKNGFSRTWNLNLHLRRVHSTHTATVGAVSDSGKNKDEAK